jgi:hypothetical protein
MKEIETQDESQDDEGVNGSPYISRKHGHDLDIIDTTQKTKRTSNNMYLIVYS